jgi:hypothetical protein
LEQKHSLFVGNGIFNRALYGGRFWGSKVGELLQKTAKFQKIPFLGVRVPEFEKSRFLSFLDPPMAGEFLAQIWVILKSIFNHFFNINFHHFLAPNFGHL